jgi:hypothetical protein
MKPIAGVNSASHNEPQASTVRNQDYAVQNQPLAFTAIFTGEYSPISRKTLRTKYDILEPG